VFFTTPASRARWSCPFFPLPTHGGRPLHACMGMNAALPFGKLLKVNSFCQRIASPKIGSSNFLVKGFYWLESRRVEKELAF
jgi:hypothetical protein